MGFPDDRFLQLNESSRVVPPERIRAARETQLREASSGVPSRTLVDILRAEHALDAAAETALREFAPETASSPDPASVSDDFLSPLDGLLDERPPAPPPGASTAVRPFGDPPSGSAAVLPAPVASSRRRPLEVEQAAREERNRFGPYILLQEVGRGGMGTVYRAWDNRLARIVAIKILHSYEPQTAGRFLREAQIAGKLQHPRIATVYDVGEWGSVSYIAMQYLDGAPIDGVPRTTIEALALVRDAARTLQYAHDQGVLHRDIKPGNFLVDREGSVYLTDFGAAKEVRAESESSLSLTRAIIGTPGYLSPEHAEGDLQKIGVRSDVYCLGATLYKLLAGRPPFDNLNLWEAILAVRRRDPKPPSAWNPSLSPELDAVVLRAMAKDPARRHPTAAALADELDRLLREGRHTGRHGLLKMLVRRWAPVAAVCLACGLATRQAVETWLVHPPPAVAAESVAELYAGAARALGVVEQGFAAMAEEERHRRLRHGVFQRLAILLAREPDHLAARVLRVRALYVDGESAAAAGELRALAAQHRGDYRIRYLSALLALDAALAAPPPWPALEAPSPDWDRPPSPAPAGAVGDLASVVKASPEPHLAEEYQRDAPAARALVPLAGGRWEEAANALAEVIRSQPLPVYVRAWCRAAYLARRFGEVEASPASAGLPERLGAAIALAAESDQPVQRLERLLPDCRGHARARVLILAGLARWTVDRGADPEPYVSAALESLSTSEAVPREMRGVVLAARLRRLALSFQDDMALYKDALNDLGEAPAGWMGRLAAVEIRLALGARLVRTGHDARPRLEEVVALSDALTAGSPAWPAPRILRAGARMRLGQHEDAWADLSGIATASAPPARALLSAASVWLHFAEDRRRGGRPFQEEAGRAREYAMAVLAGYPDHPEALNLAAAAELCLAADAEGRGGDASAFTDEAIAQSTRALDAVPRFVDACVHRAGAFHLKAEAERRGGRSGAALDERALADLDAALAAAPALSPARRLRGVVHFAMEHYGLAAADWRRILDESPGPDAAELRGWLVLAERRGR